MIFGVFVIGQIIKLQFVEKDKWKKLSLEQSIRYNEVEASRGNIYAANGELLATSLPRFDVYWDSRASGISNALFEEKS